MYADYLAELAPVGQTVWEWRSWEHLDPVADGIAEVQALRTLWAMGNSVLELPNGDILVSYRPISTVIRIDRRTGKIVWKLGPPTLAGQHAPTRLENGNILIFDNGVHRVDDPLPFSRVIEINPETNEIGWTYQDKPVSNFFSPRMGNAQRLPNGNTLINEASFGRFFEVTRDGEIVWEYVNPFFGGPPHVKPTRSSGRSDTAQRRSLVQKPRLELECLLKPRSSRGFFPLSRRTVSALLQPQSQ
jgi:outer membrane protein assembly factor BamB